LKYRRNYFAERRAITTTPEMGCYCAFVQSTRTASASTVNTLYNLSTLKFALGHSANTGCTKVGVPGLDAAQAAEVLVPRLEEKQ